MHVVTFRLNFHNLWRNFNGYSLARYESGITTLLWFSLSFFELDKFDEKENISQANGLLNHRNGCDGRHDDYKGCSEPLRGPIQFLKLQQRL